MTMMAQPNVDARKAVSFVEPIVQGTPEEITPSMDEALRKAEQDALSRKSSGNQGQSSSGAREDAASDDVIRSATPGSVKHARVVHPPLEDDYQPTFRATREQCVFYDIIRRYGNARSNSKHFKQIRKTKVIQCDATYVDVGDLADSVRPTGRLSQNVVACGIDYINKHVDICPDKVIFDYTVTSKIWSGDFNHVIIRKRFAQHGEFKLTLKNQIMFPMFQELAP